MSKKNRKFDLTHLVHEGFLKEGQTLLYVTDPTKTCKVMKQPNGEFKVKTGIEIMTIHQFAEKCLGEQPPDHATKWLKTESGQTLHELWHIKDYEDAA